MAVLHEKIQATYPTDVCRRIGDAVRKHPDQNELLALFSDIAVIVSASQRQKGFGQGTNSKKRKVENVADAAISHPSVSFECKDVSFQIPARKKLKLLLVGEQGDARRQEVRLQNQQSGEIEHAIPADQIDQAFCLPVPEKQQRQWSFVIFPKAGATNTEGTPCEQVVFTMDEKPPAGAEAREGIHESDTFVTATERELNRLLQPHGKQVVIPNASEFASRIPQPHRKGEEAYHVKAHRGSKDGYLFFLPNGIVFGFKKPLALFPFSSIQSISYTSVLQRTFNLVVASRESEEGDVKEVEFSMLDQADFAGIDEYVKRHGLNDASMAADRRAKVYGVSKEKKDEVNGEAAASGVEEEGVLAKTEQQLQDEEDECEEDYEVSGGESDGEGEEEDEEEDGEKYGDGKDVEAEEEMEDEDEGHEQ